jgi:CRISPR-associated protein Cmr6
MTVIPEPHKKVPMMFRAQAQGRCQLQRLERFGEQDIVRWKNEWVDKADESRPELPEESDHLRTKTYQIDWRLITNSGVDDSVTRPVMGAKGWPHYPGSSMKGLFRRACTKDQAAKYCGRPVKEGDWAPGNLRFLGGYPVDDSWQDGLVDILHPQQGRQVESQQRPSSAFAQVSLYRPVMQFSISSDDLAVDWEEVWAIWERAITRGLGGRVCAGYGQVRGVALPEDMKVLYSGRLRGQGQAPKLIDGSAEFRPNLFRGALRGHALRIFGGLASERVAIEMVEGLFGGVSGKGVVGLVGARFEDESLSMPLFQAETKYVQTAYVVEGVLKLIATRKMEESEEKALRKLLAKLVQFSMVLGGFGKSWRRADHRLFFDEYYEDDKHKPLIGCHWQWVGDVSQRRDVKVHRLEHLTQLMEDVRTAAREWMVLRGVKVMPRTWANWRESWCPERVQVWGRVAKDRDGSEAIRWFHGPYQRAVGQGTVAGSIYGTRDGVLAGKVGKIGRLWHRMYPVIKLLKNADDPKKPNPKVTREYFEFLTIFPDNSGESKQFIEFLESGVSGFERLWGGVPK